MSTEKLEAFPVHVQMRLLSVLVWQGLPFVVVVVMSVQPPTKTEENGMQKAVVNKPSEGNTIREATIE
jgi:hypothetical protein